MKSFENPRIDRRKREKSEEKCAKIPPYSPAFHKLLPTDGAF
jgi:hypothetical protein